MPIPIVSSPLLPYFSMDIAGGLVPRPSMHQATFTTRPAESCSKVMPVLRQAEAVVLVGGWMESLDVVMWLFYGYFIVVL